MHEQRALLSRSGEVNSLYFNICFGVKISQCENGVLRTLPYLKYMCNDLHSKYGLCSFDVLM